MSVENAADPKAESNRAAGASPWKFWIAFFACALYVCLPFWLSPMLLGVDTPNHAARVHVLANLGNSPELQQFYSASWHLIPNLGLDLILVPLAKWIPASLLMRGLMTAVILIQGLGVALLIAHFRKRLDWAGLSGIAVGYNYVSAFGFWNFGLGVGLVMLAWLIDLKLHDKDKLRPIIIMISCALLWVCHLGSCVIWLLLLGVRSVWPERDTSPPKGWILAICGAGTLVATLATRSSESGEAPQFMPLSFSLEQAWRATDGGGWTSLAGLLGLTLAAIGLSRREAVNKAAFVVGVGLLGVALFGPHTLATSAFASSRMVIPALLLLLTQLEVAELGSGLRPASVIAAAAVALACVRMISVAPYNRMQGTPVHIGNLVKRGGLVYYGAFDWQFQSHPMKAAPSTLHSNCEALFERPVFIENLFARGPQQPLRRAEHFSDMQNQPMGSGDFTAYVARRAREALAQAAALPASFGNRAVYLYVAKSPGHPLRPGWNYRRLGFRKLTDADRFTLLQLR